MEEWKEYRLGDFMEFNPKISLKKDTVARKITMDQLVSHSRDIYSWTYEPYSGGAKFQNGDTIMARITPCLENGKHAFISLLDENEIAYGSTEYIVIRGRKGISDNLFVYYLTHFPSFKDAAIKSMVGTSGRQRAQVDVLKNLTMKLPSIAEQKSIADILTKLDDKIAVNKQINDNFHYAFFEVVLIWLLTSLVNDNLEQQAQALFKSWFVDFEPFRDQPFVESELGMIPEGWKVDSLSSVADYINGLAMQKYRPIEGEAGLPVLKIKELGQGNTDDSSELCSPSLIGEKYIIDDGDIIFSWSGTLMVKVWCGGKCGLNQHLFVVKPKDYPHWFAYQWTKRHLDNFIHIAKDKAVTMGHIKRGELDKAKVVVPDGTSMATIDSMMKPLHSQIIANRIGSRRLASLRDTLLPRLMSGEIKVGDVTLKKERTEYVRTTI